MRAFLILFLSTFYFLGHGQEMQYADQIYSDQIRSVQFHVKGLPLTYPIVELSTGGQLELNFDDIGADDNYYYYSLLHCDRNWKPTQDFEKFEYIDGYEKEEIRDYEFSFGTDVDYTHYSLTLPNDDMGWKLSGNYLLIITDDDDGLVMTRRLMVVEMGVRISPEMVRPSVASKYKSHQEIDFRINPLNTRVTNPAQEITAVVMQNGRWNSAIQELKHKFIIREDLVFDYQDLIVFPALKEFRHIDITSLNFRSFNVLKINNYPDMTEVLMELDKPRKYSKFLSDIDINGKFVIKTDDRDRSFSSEFESVSFDKESLFNYGSGDLSASELAEIREQQSTVFQNNTKDNLESEYAEVILSLETGQQFPYDVYVVGGLTDWKIDPNFKMTWDDRLSGYIGKFLLKQGFYDFTYAIADENGNPDLSYVDGDWYETFNDYTVLCYYKPFSGRYEQLIGAYTFDTDRQLRN